MKHLKFRILLFSILILVSIFFPGCGKEKKLVVKIGGIFALSGGAAAYGEDIRKGAIIALEEIEKLNTLKLELIVQDSKSDKTEAIKLAEQLINVDNVIAIYGPTISPSAIAVGKLCDQYKVPMITPAATQDEITIGKEYVRKFVTRACFNDSFQGWAIAKFATENLKKKSAVIIFDKSVSYSVGLADNFKKSFLELGGQIVAEESYSVKDVDFSALVDKVSQYDAQILFIPGWDENVGPMLKQSKDKWNKFILLGGDGWPTDKFLELSGGNVGDSYALGHYILDINNSIAKKFNDAYIQKWNKSPSPHAALGYDAMMILYKALIRCKDNLSREALNKEIRATRNEQLTTGNFTVNSNGDILKKGIIFKIKKDGFQFYDAVNPR